ncbi:hypothetical protein [Streptomyces sp. NPDC101150]|uniref:hypothetical protein n=1 Tax=Streptomyces sp. NPDC101150 TaxID=3366114 RepID=UPI003827ADCE
MTEWQKLMTVEEARAPVNAALADPGVGLAVPLGLSLAPRAGLPATARSTLRRGDYHPAAADVPGSVTYGDGDQIRVVTFSNESERLLSACLSEGLTYRTRSRSGGGG